MALSCFISLLGEQGLPLYHLLKKIDQFVWTAEAQEVLDKVKELLTKAPILVPLAEKEPLLLYIATTIQVLNVVLVVERQEEGHTLKV
jgi:dsDNA-binding SOS-regulon protein